MREERETMAKRRAFLKLAGIGAASGAAAAAVGAEPAGAEDARPEGAAGYRLTPHVQKAYDLARF